MIQTIKFLMLKRKVDSLDKQIAQNTRRRLEVKSRGKKLNEQYTKSREALQSYLAKNPDVA